MAGSKRGICAGEQHPPGIRAAGGARSRGDSIGDGEPAAELRRVEWASEPGSALPEQAWGGGRDVGGTVPGAVGGDDSGAAGDLESRGGVSAAGCELSIGAADVHAGRGAGRSGVDGGE